MATDDSSAGGGSGSILTRKTGPLANWVWMALILLIAVVYAMWQRNRQQAVAPADEDQTITEVPENQTPPPVFILPQNPQPTVPINIHLPGQPPVTPPPAPPTGGRPITPGTPPAPAKPPVKFTPVVHTAVKVVKYTSSNPPWNSTMWGIAKQYGYGAAGNNYLAVWNDPKNAALKAKRKTPTQIQPGDTIYVKRK